MCDSHVEFLSRPPNSLISSSSSIPDILIDPRYFSRSYSSPHQDRRESSEAQSFTMGKKKGGSEPVPAPPALPPSSLPAAESSELVHGEAVLPPGFEEAVPFDQLFLRNKRVSFHPLFRSAESSVTALGGVLTYSETKAWQQYGETAGFVAAKHPEGNGIAHRDCGRLSVEDDTIAAAIFSRLAPFLPPSLQSRDGATWNVCGCRF